ncbi:uncharacterized protein LOC123988508 isoform X2 [Osmia bicornis bicornis]|uniref:uncharacterized protein LOC123988508 isoform X2 n=1 Tax=Osmia bicornis bicornis TaxID=1437191 RepID=UPI001EAECD0D|nr:uncharacterized protein LOC123988508 isoform X2 [Osmia bicornis bicornis]
MIDRLEITANDIGKINPSDTLGLARALQSLEIIGEYDHIPGTVGNAAEPRAAPCLVMLDLAIKREQDEEDGTFLGSIPPGELVNWRRLQTSLAEDPPLMEFTVKDNDKKIETSNKLTR